MPTAVDSAFDIAFWFIDTALDAGEHVQPQKLQRLLFLAQAYYAVLHDGQMLMPAVFVADDPGPIEPNIYIAFSKGRPNVDPSLFLPSQVEAVLRGVWRRFGHHTTDYLSRMIKETEAYRDARKQGPRSVMSFKAIQTAFARAETTPGAYQIVRPKVMRTQAGRAVVVTAWAPKAVAAT
ncbi:MAG: hypothetical protein KIT00_01565 [Rhodospirillales bacterium]|nr:hypothetical protein [Rhodospirillales bacterium]